MRFAVASTTGWLRFTKEHAPRESWALSRVVGFPQFDIPPGTVTRPNHWPRPTRSSTLYSAACTVINEASGRVGTAGTRPTNRSLRISTQPWRWLRPMAINNASSSLWQGSSRLGLASDPRSSVTNRQNNSSAPGSLLYPKLSKKRFRRWRRPQCRYFLLVERRQDVSQNSQLCAYI